MLLGSLLGYEVPLGAQRGWAGMPWVRAETKMNVSCLPRSFAERKGSLKGFSKTRNSPWPHSSAETCALSVWVEILSLGSTQMMSFSFPGFWAEPAAQASMTGDALFRRRPSATEPRPLQHPSATSLPC